MTGSSQSLSADDGAWLPIKNDCSSAKPHGRVITRALYLSKVLCRHKEGVANRGLIFIVDLIIYFYIRNNMKKISSEDLFPQDSREDYILAQKQSRIAAILIASFCIIALGALGILGLLFVAYQ